MYLIFLKSQYFIVFSSRNDNLDITTSYVSLDSMAELCSGGRLHTRIVWSLPHKKTDHPESMVMATKPSTF